MKKRVIGVSDQLWHKPVCTTTEDGQRLEILNLESRGITLSYDMKAVTKRNKA